MPPDQRRKAGLLGWILRVVVVLIVLSLISYGVMYGFARSAQSRWDRLAAELRDDGQPLTFADIQALRPKIPEQENGTVVIRAAIEMLGSATELSKKGVIVFDSECRADFFDGINQNCLPRTRAYVETRRASLDEIAKLAQFDSSRILTPASGSRDEQVRAVLPFLSEYRDLTKLLFLDAVLGIIEDDNDRAIANIDLQLRLSEPLYAEPELIAILVAIAGDALAARTTEGLLASHEFSNDELTRIAMTWNRHAKHQTILPALLGQRASAILTTDSDYLMAEMRATRKSLHLEPIALGTLRNLWNSLPYHDWFLFQNRVQSVRVLTRLIEASGDWTNLIATARREETALSRGGWGMMSIGILMPSLTRVIELHARALALSRCVPVAIAAERYRKALGRFPASSAELTPDYLDEIPLDPFDGQPLRIASTDTGIVIYSIGENGVDDGGDVVRNGRRGHAPDEGIRLLTPEHRGIRFIEESDSD